MSTELPKVVYNKIPHLANNEIWFSNDLRLRIEQLLEMGDALGDQAEAIIFGKPFEPADLERVAQNMDQTLIDLDVFLRAHGIIIPDIQEKITKADSQRTPIDVLAVHHAEIYDRRTLIVKIRVKLNKIMEDHALKAAQLIELDRKTNQSKK